MYYYLLYVGGSRAPILYHDTMYYHIFDVYIKSFMVIDLFIYMCKKCVCDEFTVNETNSNLTRSYHMSQQLDY